MSTAKKRRPSAGITKASRKTRGTSAKFKKRQAAALRHLQTLLDSVELLKAQVDELAHKKLDAKTERANDAYHAFDAVIDIEIKLAERGPDIMIDHLIDALGLEFDEKIAELQQTIDNISEAG